MTLKPAEDLGPVLTGRAVAARIREDVERALSAGENVVVDLQGVEFVSPSFADELFAKVPRTALEDGRLSLAHVNEDTAELIRFVQFGRS